MVKRLFFLLHIYSLSLLSSTKIGILDLKRVTQSYEGMREIKLDIERLEREWEEELKKKKSKIDSLVKLYEREKPALSEEARLKREAEIENLRRDYQNFIKEIWGKGGRVEQKTEELIKPITEKIRKVIKEVAEEEGVDIVFDSSKDDILYTKEAIDLTDRVIERLNREYKGREREPAIITRKIRIAIFPFKLSSELFGSIHYQVFMSELEKAVRKSPKFEVTGFEVSESAIKSIGYDKNTLPLSQINFVITQIGVEYALYGELKRKGGTTLEALFYLYDIKGEKIFENVLTFEETEEKVKEAAYSTAQSVINYFAEKR
ncbi:MAG: OmpH family outer membrane protein [Candidatus Hydrothermales bacterium]